jgi:hypothetical protein
VGNIPIAGVVGEAVETEGYDLRVLDTFVADHYYYATDPYLGEYQEAFPTAGQFLVVNYSVRNTGAQTVGPNLIGTLHTRAPDGKIEVYDQTDLVSPPHRPSGDLYLDDIPTRQLLVSQFIFDVPTDVEPEVLAVTEEPQIGTVYDVGAVDLTTSSPALISPEEILSLQYEYYNMTAWSAAYDLFAQESKDRVPEQTFVSKNQQQIKKYREAFTKYSFPSVEVAGDRATMKVVRTASWKDDEYQDRITQEAVKEDEDWRIVMRDKQYKFYGSG